LPGTHLQVLRDTQFAGHFDLHYLLCVPETLGDAEETVQELARLDRPPLTTPLVGSCSIRRTTMKSPGRSAAHCRNQPRTRPLEERAVGAAEHRHARCKASGSCSPTWVCCFSQSSPGSLAAQSGTPPVREFTASLSHWRQLFDFGGTAKPRARQSCAGLIASRASHG
jgi:hypothetical protein